MTNPTPAEIAQAEREAREARKAADREQTPSAEAHARAEAARAAWFRAGCPV